MINFATGIVIVTIIIVFMTIYSTSSGTEPTQLQLPAQQPASQQTPWTTNLAPTANTPAIKSNTYTVSAGEYSVYNNSAFAQGTISSVAVDLPTCASMCSTDPSCFAFGHDGARCHRYAPNIYPSGTIVGDDMVKDSAGQNLYVKSPNFKNPSADSGKCVAKSGICDNTYYNNLCPAKITKAACDVIGCCAWAVA